MKCFDLFSGIGGFHLGMQRAGHTIIGACEIDKHARAVYARHFPRTKIWEDARAIDPSDIPDFDCLCAGFPCQAFSHIGKKLGFKDPRGTLFNEIARIARQKRPRLLLLENVRGLLQHDGGRTLTKILSTFNELGYRAEWQIIDSKYFVPQHRERIYIVCHLGNRDTGQIFPFGDRAEGNTTTRRATKEKGKRISDAVITRTIDTHSGNKGGTNTMIVMDGGVPPPTPPTLNAVRQSAWGGGRIYSLANDNADIVSTLTTSGHNGYYYRDSEKRVRRLMPVECERLQGFPDKWTDVISERQRYKCLGNSVTVNVVQALGKRLHEMYDSVDSNNSIVTNDTNSSHEIGQKREEKW